MHLPDLILLQAAMAAGLLLVVVFFIFMTISTIVITRFLKNRVLAPSLNDVGSWIISIVLAGVISLLLFIAGIFIFDFIFPDFLKDS